MNQKRLKSWKYYVLLFAAAFVILGAVALIKNFSGTYVAGDLWNTIIFPPLLALMMFLSDYMMQKLADKKGKKDFEGRYLDAIAEKMRAANLFLIEDFRRLKESERFQEALKYGFYITQHGENEKFTVARLEKRFDGRGLEAKAMPFVIAHVREILAEKQK
jgi:hypothetical protein